MPAGWRGRSDHCWDSSLALVANHDDPAKCSRLSFGELLQSKDYAVEQMRSVYTGLKWGKGLSAVIHEVWELIAKAERENRLLKDERRCQSWLLFHGLATMFMATSVTKAARGFIRRT